MLTAIMENNERLCLGDGWDKEKLQIIRENQSFFCPICHEKLILKLGEKRIFHFSHIKKSHCVFEQEAESEYHLNGKLQLYEWLKKQNLHPVLEYYDPYIKQKADVLFFLENERYVLEFQCSTISQSVFQKRTEGYLSNDYDPIWILGANQLSRKKAYLTSFTDFHYLFLRKTSTHKWMIPFYCSDLKKFMIHRSIVPISIRNAFSDVSFTNIENINIAHLLATPYEPKLNSSLWLKELTLQKNKSLLYPGAFQNHFLQTLYLNNLNILLLPPFLGLPVQNSACIMTPPLIWQTYLFIDILLNKELNTVIHFHQVYSALKKRVFTKQIKIRQIPQIKEDYVPFVLFRYLQLLVKMNVLRELNDKTYILNQKIEIPKSVLEQKKMEEKFYQNFSKNIF